MPGQRAEHHVAHIVTRGIAWSQAGCEQCLDQSAMLAANAANLQVATVGGLDHAASKTLRRRRHGFSLLGQQQATRQLDAADTAITGTDNAPQPRAGRGAGRYVGGMGLRQRGIRQSVKMRLSVEGAVLCLLCPAA